MIRIDAHHHVWELGRRPQPWLDGAGMAAIRRDFTLADLAPLTAAAGIDRTILVQVLPSQAETAEFLALAAEPGPVAGVVGWTDLASESIRQALAALRSGRGGAHLVGIRHLVQGEPDPRWLARTIAKLSEWTWSTLKLKGEPPLTFETVCLVGEEVTVNDAKARHELGYRATVSFEEGVAMMKVA